MSRTGIPLVHRFFIDWSIIAPATLSTSGTRIVFFEAIASSDSIVSAATCHYSVQTQRTTAVRRTSTCSKEPHAGTAVSILPPGTVLVLDYLFSIVPLNLVPVNWLPVCTPLVNLCFEVPYLEVP